MTLATYAAQRRKLEQEIQRLQKEAEALEKKQRTPVIRDIVRNMRDFNISLEEIEAALNRRSRGTASLGDTNVTRTPVPPKYRDPETGATWSGRGKAPRWISAAEAEGKSRDSFLINP